MKIIITDDDKFVSMSLKTILESTGEIEVLATASSGEEAIELYNTHKPDIMLMDIRMNGMTGIEAGEQILRNDSSARILYLTTFSDDEYIIKALTMGAKGYILKQDFEGIAPALKAVMNGQSVFGDSVVSRLVVHNPHEYDFEAHNLADKEREIIELVASGLSNKEISGKLFLSEGTVRNYISGILEKLDLRDRTQLAIYYYTDIKG